MQISGIQKLTLLDYPGTVACTMFTSGCNFRCPFCHNALLVLPDRIEDSFLTEDEVMGFLKKRFGVLDGVAVTGGEPLIHADMPQLLEKIKAIGYKIKLDTNGSNPKLLREIVEAGLVDRVAMDIKNSPAAYGETIGISDFDITKVEESKNLLLQGKVEYEFRTTVVKGIHTRESLVEAAKWIQGANEYYLQQFKDSGDLILPEGLGAYDKEEMTELCDAVRRYVPSAQIRGV
ncbi:MAG: anaerobic ribonucleoside-triphosphate reductase activating protein [Bacillota bacterium]|nr:anaerobic ribonucleoside-triphosphate reductase activating protein [Bacillota bacterium]